MRKMLIVLLCLMLTAAPLMPALASSGPDAEAPSQSMELMFAALQLEMAEINKQQAMDRMNAIQQMQEEQREIAGYINAARSQQTLAKEGKGDAEYPERTAVPADMAAYLQRYSLSCPQGIAGKLNISEWDEVIAALEERMKELGEKIQQEMILVQDSMNQYNSYLQGANTQIVTGTEALHSLARGQSMYGEAEVGLAISGVVIGLVLGCLMTLGAQKLGKGKQGK